MCCALICHPIWSHMLCMYVRMCAHERYVRTFIPRRCMYVRMRVPQLAYARFHSCEWMHACEYVRASTRNLLLVFCFLRLSTRTRRMITVIAARWCMYVRTCVHQCMFVCKVHAYTATPGRLFMYVCVSAWTRRMLYQVVLVRAHVCVHESGICWDEATHVTRVFLSVCVNKAHTSCNCRKAMMHVCVHG